MLETALAPTDRLIGPLPRGMIRIENRCDELALTLLAVGRPIHLAIIRAWTPDELERVEVLAEAVYRGQQEPEVLEVLRG